MSMSNVRYKKMFWRKPVFKNCVICAIQPTLYFSATIADPSYLFICCHHNNKPSPRIVRVNCFYPCLCLGLFTFSCALLFVMEMVYRKKLDFVSASLYLTNITFCLRSSLTVLAPLLLKRKHGKREIEGLIEILENFESHTPSGDLLNKKLVASFRLQGLFGGAFVLIAMMLYGILLLRVEANFFVMYKSMAVMCCFYTDLILFLATSVRLKIYTCLFRQTQNLLKLNLHKRWVTFSRCRRLHAALTRNLFEWQQLHDPLTVVWLLCAIGIMVGNNYVIIKAFANNSTDLLLHSHYISVQLQSYLTASIIGICIIYVDELYRVVSFRINQ